MKKRLCFFLCFLIQLTGLEAVRLIEPIEVIFKVEDGDFKKVVVKKMIFANQVIDLDVTSSSLVRKKMKLQLDPGIYFVEWITEEHQVPGGRVQTKHKKVIELEVEDRLINLWIKGDKLTFF